jgi:hypothetical protein
VHIAQPSGIGSNRALNKGADNQVGRRGQRLTGPLVKRTAIGTLVEVTNWFTVSC